MINIRNKFKIFEILIITLFFLLLLAITFTIFTIIGIGFLSFLGFEYNSLKSVLLFFIMYFCISRPLDLISISVLDVIKYRNKISYNYYKLIEAFFDISFTIILINILDMFMNSIVIPLHTEILFAILSYLFSECMDSIFNKKK